MTTRKARIYLVQMGNETKLVRANGVSRAIQTAAKGFMVARVAEPDDLIRIANQAGAGLQVATPPEPAEGAPRRGRPPRAATAPDSVIDPGYEPSQAAA
jgi:hypothetical protein